MELKEESRKKITLVQEKACTIDTDVVLATKTDIFSVPYVDQLSVACSRGKHVKPQ
jgi:hypothetical protein